MVRNIVYNDYPHNIFKLKSERFKQARTKAVERRRRQEIIKNPFKVINNAVENIKKALINIALQFKKAIKPMIDWINTINHPLISSKNKLKASNMIINPYFKYDTKIKIIRTGENP